MHDRAVHDVPRATLSARRVGEISRARLIGDVTYSNDLRNLKRGTAVLSADGRTARTVKHKRMRLVEEDDDYDALPLSELKVLCALRTALCSHLLDVHANPRAATSQRPYELARTGCVIEVVRHLESEAMEGLGQIVVVRGNRRNFPYGACPGATVGKPVDAQAPLTAYVAVDRVSGSVRCMLAN